MNNIEFSFYEHVSGGFTRRTAAAPIVQVHCSTCNLDTCIDLRVVRMLSHEHPSSAAVWSTLRCGRCSSSRVRPRGTIGVPWSSPIHSNVVSIEGFRWAVDS